MLTHFSMPIILLGDPCSGKTSTLQRLKELGYSVVLEEGWKQIPPDIEQDKFQSNLWFTNYFYHRDKHHWGKNTIFEYCLHYQYSFTNAQFQCEKINGKQKLEALALLTSLVKKLPLHRDDLVIHFTCSSALTNQRLAERGRQQSPSQDEYRRVLRQEIEAYFRSQCRYVVIDTTRLSRDETFRSVLRLLSFPSPSKYPTTLQ